MPESTTNDVKYLALIRDALGKCRDYRPKFGRGGAVGLTLDEFRHLYQSDEFYHWFGLDSPLLYAAHRAAGGITSIYRQIGIGCQWLFQNLLQDTLGLSPAQATWAYTVPSTSGKSRTLSLDGRIPIDEVADRDRRARIAAWLSRASDAVQLPVKSRKRLAGCVFEVRQGYKSADSKRQNADIANAANAYAQRYVPVVLLFSTQIDSAIAERYVRAQWLLLRGTTVGSSTDSTYVFCREVLRYDLAGFFQRNAAIVRQDVEAIVEGLLR